MKSYRGTFVSLALALPMLAGCSPARLAQAEAYRLQQLQQIAGEPVDAVRYHRTASWEALAEDHLLLWTRRQEPWLVRVQRPCHELQWATSIRVDASGGQLRSGFDAVQVRQQRCRIEEIRPLDPDAVRALRASQRRDPAQPGGGT